MCIIIKQCFITLRKLLHINKVAITTLVIIFHVDEISICDNKPAVSWVLLWNIYFITWKNRRQIINHKSPIITLKPQKHSWSVTYSLSDSGSREMAGSWIIMERLRQGGMETECCGLMRLLVRGAMMMMMMMMLSEFRQMEQNFAH